MMTIEKVRLADCDRDTDGNGNFADDGYQYVVCEDNDIGKDYGWFLTEMEAEQFINED